MKTTFDADEIARLRRRAREAAELPRDLPQGWSLSPVDPAVLLPFFAPVRLKPGLALRAYLFTEGGNGNGFVRALPESVDLPLPEDCVKREWGHFLAPPVPPGALADVMEAFEGDGGPRSFLMASLLGRELAEFGARWHGIQWGTRRVLGAQAADRIRWGDPRHNDFPPTKAWRWLKGRPRAWAPSVEVRPRSATVRFYTHGALENHTIARHTDRYGKGSLAFRETVETVAEGPPGYVH